MNLVKYDEFEKEVFCYAFNRTVPENISWEKVLKLDKEQNSLFSEKSQLIYPSENYIKEIKSAFFYKQYKQLAKGVICHSNIKKFHHLYSLFIKLLSNPRILGNHLDEDVREILRYKKQVSRDVHKMHAFVRFNKQEFNNKEIYVSKHEPDHFILQRGAYLFVDRFPHMDWIIYSDVEMIFWDQNILHHKTGDFSKLDLKEDQFIGLWKEYFSSTFNPARLKIKAMKNEMPVRYWKNMPETELISELIKEAPKRVLSMVKDESASMESIVNANVSLKNFNECVSKCKACSLRCSSQNLISDFKADYIFISDHELSNDIKLDIFSELFKVGITANKIAFTAVTKHTLHGKSKEQIQSIMICRSWLKKEIELKSPKGIICLGTKSVHSIFGYPAFDKSIINKVHRTDISPLTLVLDKIDDKFNYKELKDGIRKLDFVYNNLFQEKPQKLIS